MLSVAEQFLTQQIHPTVIISAYRLALEDMLAMLKDIRYASVLDTLWSMPETRRVFRA